MGVLEDTELPNTLEMAQKYREKSVTLRVGETRSASAGGRHVKSLDGMNGLCSLVRPRTVMGGSRRGHVAYWKVEGM